MERMVLALLLSVAIIVHPCASYEEDNESYLTIDLLRKDRVDGSYVNPQLGCGIVFNSTKDGLTVSSLNGSRLLSAEEQVGPVRLVTLGNREFIQHRESGDDFSTVQDYAIPKYHGSFAGTQDRETFLNLISKLKRLDPNAHSRVLEKSVRRALSKQEIRLLKDAAIAMGRRGVTGQDYPSTLPLYMTALRMKSYSDANIHVFTDQNVKFHELRLRREDCLSDCPPCESQECLGMCGPGCDCWKWTCGNCCYNKGCYYHDLCCRSKPNSLACLLPMSFDCDSKYVCEDPTVDKPVSPLTIKLGGNYNDKN